MGKILVIIGVSLLLSCAVNMVTHRWELVYPLNRYLDDSLLGNGLSSV